MKNVVIIGAGLSGLSCAHYLDKSKYNIKVFESTSHPGGRAKSENIDGYICDVGFQVLGHALFRQRNGTASGATLSGRVGKLKCLLNGEVFQAFDLQHATREGVFLAGFLDGQ